MCTFHYPAKHQQRNGTIERKKMKDRTERERDTDRKVNRTSSNFHLTAYEEIAGKVSQ